MSVEQQIAGLIMAAVVGAAIPFVHRWLMCFHSKEEPDNVE